MSLRVYVAGPYSGENVTNIRVAIDAAEKVVDLGHTPFVPHLSGFWDLVHPRPYAWWLAYDIQWLLVCDVLLRLPGPSAGADKEEAVARLHGIPICYSLAELPPSTGQLVGINVNGSVKVTEHPFDNAAQEVDSGAADTPSTPPGSHPARDMAEG